ncbi:rCG31155, partial [Rattus norvegicus]
MGTPFAEIPSHKLHFQLDHLSHLDSQYKFGFRLMSSGTEGALVATVSIVPTPQVCQLLRDDIASVTRTFWPYSPIP